MKEERFRKFETVHAIGELLRKATGNENVGAYYDEDTDAVDVYLDDRLLVVVSVMGDSPIAIAIVGNVVPRVVAKLV